MCTNTNYVFYKKQTEESLYLNDNNLDKDETSQIFFWMEAEGIYTSWDFFWITLQFITPIFLWQLTCKGKTSNFLSHCTVSQSFAQSFSKLPTNVPSNHWNSFQWKMPVTRLRQHYKLGSCFSWRSLDRLSGNDKQKWI